MLCVCLRADLDIVLQQSPGSAENQTTVPGAGTLQPSAALC